MGSPLFSRATFAAAATLGVVGCATSQPDTSEVSNDVSKAEIRPGMFLHGQRRETGAKVFSAPPGAHLIYFGGRVVSNIEVVQVIYGAGSYIPQVLSTGTPSMASFYQGVLNSAYVDWLTEYNTNTQPPPNSNQTLGRGSFSTQVTITPSAANNGTVIDDNQIQAELAAQIAAGNIPPPTHDAAGNNNTYYAFFFPHGKTITLGGAASCQIFCAYHGTIANASGLGEIEYGVHPDFQPGSGCENGCGAAATQFGNYTQVASHELIETMTDPEVGLATVFGPPLAWADLVFSEIGDICNDQNGHVVGGDGVTYDVQTEFSNSVNDCIVTNPLATPLVATAPGEVCRGSTALSTVTVFGGAGRFTSDVTLSLTSVNPATPAGAITALFDPNPVPTPSTNGSNATMRIATTTAAPAGTYTLTVQGASTSLTTTTTEQLVVRSDAPVAPSPTSPANGADGVSSKATFTWGAAPQAASYEVEVFDGDSCSGRPIRILDSTSTTATIPDGQELADFHTFSWHVSASNACGPGATSACLSFRTASCSEAHEATTNGGFENGLTGWTVDLAVPPPVADGTRPHSGATAVSLGTFTGISEPLGDSQISQTFTLATGGATKLSFSEWPLTTDTVAFDQQYVRVTPINPAGATVVLMNEARNDQTYLQRSFDLTAFAGMTIKLTFGVHQDGFGDITGMFVDDISVTSQNCGPPEFAVHITPASSEICAGNSIPYTVSVESVNGPNFTSAVTLATGALPPGATASFGRTTLNPGESTTLTVSTARTTPGDTFPVTVVGTAVTPPPNGPRTATASLLVDPNAPTPPETVSPRVGEVNVPRRPTLSWTAPFIPDATLAGKSSTPGGSPPARTPFTWELAATSAPRGTNLGTRPGAAPSGTSGTSEYLGPVVPFAFGTSTYHLQIARDAAFSSIVVDTTVSTTSFTLTTDLEVATQYFWRVSAVNACGTSAFSNVGSFIVGACFEGWGLSTAFPTADGPLQETVIGSPADNKLYVIGGGFGSGPNVRTNETWTFEPQTGAWTRKADVPAPGIGSNFGSAARLGTSIYVFGGVNGPPGPIVVHRAAWRYDIPGNTWTRLADLPTDNFGAAVGAIGGKIYLAYGSGFVTQTWQYDPATDTYTRKAEAPSVPQTFRLHGAVAGGELHAFAGGFEGNSHVIYNPASNTWRTGPLMPFTATDPAVDAFAGKIYVVGGRPTAHTQIFDPATGTWSQAAPISDATNGIDNTAGAALGAAFHLIGGFNGINGISTHWRFHACDLGTLSSATLIPFVADGNGQVAGVFNERSSVLIDNSISGTSLSVSCFLYGTSGDVLGHDTFAVAPNELKTITDVVRALTHTTAVQNTIGSVAVFGTEVFHGMGSLSNNASSDPAMEDGQSLAGRTSGFVSTVGTAGYLTQAAFTNASASTSVVTVLAYPASGGTTPSAGTVIFLPPHGMASFPNIIQRLGLAAGTVAQLSWSASQPIAVTARDVTTNKNFSGIEPSHSAADASSNVAVPYVEDTASYSTALELSNPGPITANVTVRFIENGDGSGGSSGPEHTRDIPVPVNSALPIANIVRWAQHDASTTPSGKRGFLVVTSPQGVTAQARIVSSVSHDPAIPESASAITSGFSPLLIRVEPLPFSQIGMAGTTPNSTTRFALSNPGATPATVQLTAFNATGSVAGNTVVNVAPDGQFFTENLAATMGLPPVFLGWVTVGASVPVQVFNQRQTGDGGSAVPVH